MKHDDPSRDPFVDLSIEDDNVDRHLDSEAPTQPEDPRFFRVVSYVRLRTQVEHAKAMVEKERAALHVDKVRVQAARRKYRDAQMRYRAGRLDLDAAMEARRKARLRLLAMPIDAVIRLRVDVDTGEGWTLPRGPHIIEDVDRTDALVMIRVDGRDWWIPQKHVIVTRRPWDAIRDKVKLAEGDAGEGAHITWQGTTGQILLARYTDSGAMAVRLAMTETGRCEIGLRDKHGHPIRTRQWAGSMKGGVRKAVAALARVYGHVAEDNMPSFAKPKAKGRSKG